MPAPTTTDLQTSPPPSTEQSGAQQIAMLMDQMQSKDALVVQLTERLEAAAEQLDRMQRTGADKARPGSPGSSRELAEQAGQLTTRVEEALEVWNQSSSNYDVILQRLDEISHYLSQPSEGGEPRTAAKPASGLFQAPASAGSSAPKAGSANGSASGPGQGSFWEKMKASMVDGSPAPVSPGAKSPTLAQTTSYDTMDDAARSESIEDTLAAIESIATAPTVIAVETASIEELREAVTARDAYISALISEFRTVQSLPSLPDDFENSGLAPAELLVSLKDLETRLKTGIQRENFELSLEKARMGRERSRLDQVKAQLEGQIKRLATSVAEKPEGTATSPSPAEPSVAEGKLSWLKRLQPKKP